MWQCLPNAEISFILLHQVKAEGSQSDYSSPDSQTRSQFCVIHIRQWMNWELLHQGNDVSVDSDSIRTVSCFKVECSYYERLHMKNFFLLSNCVLNVSHNDWLMFMCETFNVWHDGLPDLWRTADSAAPDCWRCSLVSCVLQESLSVPHARLEADAKTETHTHPSYTVNIHHDMTRVCEVLFCHLYAGLLRGSGRHLNSILNHRSFYRKTHDRSRDGSGRSVVLWELKHIHTNIHSICGFCSFIQHSAEIITLT